MIEPTTMLPSIRTHGPLEPLLDIPKAAETLNISPWTLRLYIRRGQITPIVRIGRRVLLSANTIRRVIEEGIPALSKSQTETE